MARNNVTLFVDADELKYLIALVEGDEEVRTESRFEDVDAGLVQSQLEDALEQIGGGDG